MTDTNNEVKVAKRKLSDFNFNFEGAHLAVVSEDQGGAANGYSTLIMKSTKDVTDELVEKATRVQVEMDFEDFLSKFFGMYSSDAELLATVLGFDDDSDEEDENYDSPQSYQDYIDQQASNIKILKSLYECSTSLGELKADEFVSVLESQQILEKAVLTISKATKKEGSDTLSASAYAYVPDVKMPSTWKLRIDDSTHTSAAVAALGEGFRGQKVSIPEKDMPSVKRKVAAAYKKFFPDNEVPTILKSVKNMSEKIEKSLHETLLTKAVEDAVAIVKSELDGVKQELEVFKAQKAIEVEKSRKEKLEAIIGTADLESTFNVVKSLDDAAFEVILKGFDTSKKIESKSDMFVEKGVETKADANVEVKPVHFNKFINKGNK